MANSPARFISGSLSAAPRAWQWLFHQRANGLNDDTWTPVILVDGQSVAPLMKELRTAGIPAYCACFRPGWHIPPQSPVWCLWVGQGAYPKAKGKIAEVLAQLAEARRRPPIGLTSGH